MSHLNLCCEDITSEVSFFLSQLVSQVVQIGIGLLKLSIRSFMIRLDFRLFTFLVPTKN